MKKIILSIFALGTLAMNAQDGSFSKGNVALSGEVGNLTTKILDANVSPSMMYFVTDNIALRGGLTFGNSETTVAGVSTGESSAFGVNFGANYYFSKSRFHLKRNPCKRISTYFQEIDFISFEMK